MAAHVFSNGFFSINGVDLSDHVKSVTLNINVDAPEITAMGDGTRERLAGLKDWDISIQFNQNFDASKVDATFWAIIDGGAAVAAIMRPDAGVVGTTNPQYSGNVIVTSYSPMDGAVGDAHATGPSMQAAGALTRATA